MTKVTDVSRPVTPPGPFTAQLSQMGRYTNMAGKIRQMIDTVVNQRAQNNEVLAGIIKTKLLLKGIDTNKFTAQSEDDPVIISKLQTLLKDI